MILLIILFFLFSSIYEWTFLKRKNRKKRTFWIVFGIMSLSFIYCIATVIFKQMPSPNNLIDFIFKPLQQKILG